jgi:leucyl aminopeptidase
MPSAWLRPAPRLIDIVWGDASHPKVTLVGKGVCFDTGGLDLKPSSGMLIMKKDMGGAANVLALAQMIMDAKLKAPLRVLIPAVENSVAGNAFRPLDIFPSRKGRQCRDRQHRRRRPSCARRRTRAGG